MDYATTQDVRISDDGRITVGPKRRTPRTAITVDAPTNDKPRKDLNLILQPGENGGGTKPMK